MTPGRDCDRCPRLVSFRETNRLRNPDWHNAPVPSFGAARAGLLIVGLAPGLRGANRSGRPFTGDAAGDLLYPTLLRFGFARGAYRATPDDGLELVGCRITNAVRCVPPENKPTGAEIGACNGFLADEINRLTTLRGILALGGIAHRAVLRALGHRDRYAFTHGAIHEWPQGPFLADSYHCSRYNVNTRRLTSEMFDAVFATLRARLDG